jgi:tripartite-type tricarboxylate transporter receptor subunit TctC
MLLSSVRRRLLLLALACSAVSSHAAGWPTKPINLVVPWPAGGATDVAARVIAPLLAEDLKQPVIVLNKAGATGNLGAEAVLQTPPDGYNLFLGSGSHLINSALSEYNEQPLRYNVTKDFDFVTVVTDLRMVMVVNPAVKANTLQELAALAKANPGKLTFSSSGNGSTQHLAGELFLKAAGVDMLHVPYKGIAPSVNDLIAGVVNMSIESLASVLPHIKAGKLRAIAVMSGEPIPALPNVPLAKSTYPQLVVSGPQYIGVPKGTPAAAVNRLNAAFVKVLQDPTVRARLDGLGVAAVTASPEESTRMIRAEREKWARVIKDANIKIE